MTPLDAITILITDVDGVLTDGRIRMLPDGEEIKVFNARDGSAIRMALEEGIDVAFLSGRGGGAVEARARELGVTRMVLGSRDKVRDFEKLLEDAEKTPDCAAYIGDDSIDLPVLKRAGFSACPSDAAADVKAVVDRVLRTPGGAGAIREVVESLLAARRR